MAQFSSLDTSAIQARQDIPPFLILILLTFIKKTFLIFSCDNENTKARWMILSKSIWKQPTFLKVKKDDGTRQRQLLYEWSIRNTIADNVLALISQ